MLVSQSRGSPQSSWQLQCGEQTTDRGQIYQGGAYGRYFRAALAKTLYYNQGTYGKSRTPGPISLVPKGGMDSAGKFVGAIQLEYCY
jgi:hypothetical protein